MNTSFFVILCSLFPSGGSSASSPVPPRCAPAAPWASAGVHSGSGSAAAVAVRCWRRAPRGEVSGEAGAPLCRGGGCSASRRVCSAQAGSSCCVLRALHGPPLFPSESPGCDVFGGVVWGTGRYGTAELRVGRTRERMWSLDTLGALVLIGSDALCAETTAWVSWRPLRSTQPFEILARNGSHPGTSAGRGDGGTTLLRIEARRLYILTPASMGYEGCRRCAGGRFRNPTAVHLGSPRLAA